MNRLVLLTNTNRPPLTPTASDQIALVGPALAICWQQPVAPWLSAIAQAGHLYALSEELGNHPLPPLPIQPLADHQALLQLMLAAESVVAGD